MSRTKANPAELRRILQQQLKCSRQMTLLAGRQTDALTANDPARLATLETEIRACIELQEELETSRAALSRELAWSLGFDKVPTLTIMLPKLPPREQEALKQVRDELCAAQEELKILKARNSQLLESALDYVEFSLGVLTSAALQPARYGVNLTHIAAPAFYIDSKA